MPLWVKKTTGHRFRLFFATDIHGSEPTFRKFINVGKFYGVDALILGGDITGKLMIPIIDLGGKRFRASLQSQIHHLSHEDLPDFSARLGKLGFYSSVLSQDEYAQLAEDSAAVNQLYIQKAKERLVAWIRMAEERLSGSGIYCYITGGNDDPPEVLEVLNDEAKRQVIACEQKVVTLDDDGHNMISLGYSNPTPWKTPREIEEPELSRRIAEAFTGIENCERLIFNMHVPPLNSTLDLCPMLDASTDPPKVITSGGEPVMVGAGSQAVRKAIEQYQPLLSLHGHIHESRNVAKIGRTTAVNPGSEYGEGILRGIIVSLTGDKVESTQMTSG